MRKARRLVLRSLRWALPLASVMAISASLAWGMNGALVAATADPAHSVVAAPLARDAAIFMSSPLCGRPDDRLSYVGLNTWMPAEGPDPACGEPSR